MSERLIKVVNDALIKKGMGRLSELSGLSENAIRGIASGSRVPRKRNAYHLALACECGETEALELAYECHRSRAKKAG